MSPQCLQVKVHHMKLLQPKKCKMWLKRECLMRVVALTQPKKTQSEASSVAEVIESLPEETDLIVIDEDGEVLPLASEAAAEVIKVADPQWCPVGVTPGAASCSGPKPSFNGPGGLIEWLINESPNKAGVIWIEADYVGTLALEGGPV